MCLVNYSGIGGGTRTVSCHRTGLCDRRRRDQAQKNGDHRPSDGDRSAVLLYLFTIWKIESNRIRTGAVLLITAGFLWIHQAFTAMILSGAYVLVLLMLGARIRRGMDREHRWREYHVITGLADFLLGSGFMICLFCLGSLFFGCGITSFRFLTVVIAGLLAGYRMMELRAAGDSGMPWKRVPQRTRISWRCPSVSRSCSP